MLSSVGLLPGEAGGLWRASWTRIMEFVVVLWGECHTAEKVLRCLRATLKTQQPHYRLAFPFWTYESQNRRLKYFLDILVVKASKIVNSSSWRKGVPKRIKIIFKPKTKTRFLNQKMLPQKRKKDQIPLLKKSCGWSDRKTMHPSARLSK